MRQGTAASRCTMPRTRTEGRLPASPSHRRQVPRHPAADYVKEVEPWSPSQPVHGRHRRRSLVLVAALLVSLLVPDRRRRRGEPDRTRPRDPSTCSSSPSMTSTATSSRRRVPRAASPCPAGTGQRGRRRRTSPRTSSSSREGHPNSITVSAGDNIGASPLISGYFHDEPTIEALNAAQARDRIRRQPRVRRGLRRAAAHAERRLPASTNDPIDSCPTRPSLRRRRLPVPRRPTSSARTPARPSSPPTRSASIDGVRVAFIGLTLEGTPTIVTPSGVAGLTFKDEADTVNAIVQKLERQERIETFVVLLHEGGIQAAARLHQRLRRHVAAPSSASSASSARASMPSSRATPISPTTASSPNAAGKKILVTQRELVRPPGDRCRPAHRPQRPATSPQAQAENVIVTRDVPTDPDRGRHHRQVQRAHRRRQERASSARSPRDLTRTGNAAGETGARRRHRRCAARGGRQTSSEPSSPS